MNTKFNIDNIKYLLGRIQIHLEDLEKPEPIPPITESCKTSYLIEKHLDAVREGNSEAVAIQNVALSHGYRFRDSARDNSCRCISYIYHLYRKYPDLFQAIWKEAVRKNRRGGLERKNFVRALKVCLDRQNADTATLFSSTVKEIPF